MTQQCGLESGHQMAWPWNGSLGEGSVSTPGHADWGQLPLAAGVKPREPVSLRDRVGVCRQSTGSLWLDPQVHRVSTDHWETQLGCCWMFWIRCQVAYWCAREPALQKTKAKISISSIGWFPQCKNSKLGQFQATSGLRIGSPNCRIFNNWFPHAGRAGSSRTLRQPLEGWSWHLKASPENYHQQMMSHFLW